MQFLDALHCLSSLWSYLYSINIFLPIKELPRMTPEETSKTCTDLSPALACGKPPTVPLLHGLNKKDVKTRKSLGLIKALETHWYQAENNWKGEDIANYRNVKHNRRNSKRGSDQDIQHHDMLSKNWLFISCKIYSFHVMWQHRVNLGKYF